MDELDEHGEGDTISLLFAHGSGMNSQATGGIRSRRRGAWVEAAENHVVVKI